MAENVLSKTPEADIAAAITGHLGPNAPETQDGLVFIAVSKRQNSGFSTVINKFIILPQSNKTPEKLRQIRQKSASLHVLFMVRSLLKRRNSKGVS
jgi:nicotinamide mononucleotide (NMN) deamidase PncC